MATHPTLVRDGDGFTAVLPTAGDTHALGMALAGVARAGDLIVLDGPLGAGKTALTQGIGAGLGVRGAVTSPTFVIARRHPPGHPEGLVLVHADAYRLGGVDELDDLDLDEDMASGITVVEWGQGLAERLSDGAYLEIGLRRVEGVTGSGEDAETRHARLTPHGADWTTRLDGLAVALR